MFRYSLKSKSNFPCLLALVCFVFTEACSPSLPDQVQYELSKIDGKVDFNFDVKPILSDRCFQCHGPDENERKANLRLDIESMAFGALSGGKGKAIVRGRPLRSQAILRMISEDHDFMMPPPESNLQLRDDEIAIVIKWIEQGAPWTEHWSFIPPVKQDPPVDIPGTWKEANEIDGFIYDKIKEHGLVPSPAATDERLLRRLYMDLTGLPPTVQEIDAFLADSDIEGYERVVDHLLASRAHAERMAMDWMDIARYADSHGLHADGWRMMWPWRDWVIDAFHDNQPYDQFITEQLAGDLIPGATDRQILATAFNRNHTMTAEGGAIDEEWRLSYVYDRTETMSTALLGMTMGCAKCHDHKYDPFTQKEYYQLASFFNNVKELGMTGDDGNYGPMLLMTDDGVKAKIASLQSSIEQKEAELGSLEKRTADVKDYIKGLGKKSLDKGLAGHYPMDNKTASQNKDGRKLYRLDNKESITYGDGKLLPGKHDNALVFEKDFSDLYLNKVGFYEMTDAFSVATWVKTEKQDSAKTQTLLGNTGDKNNFWRGWELYLDGVNRLNCRLIHSLPHNYLHVNTETIIPTGQWHHIALSYNGSGKADGVRLFINGELQPTLTRYDRLYKSILPVQGGNHQPDQRGLRVGKSGRNYTGENGIFIGQIDEMRIYHRELSSWEIALLAGYTDLNDKELHRDYQLKQRPEYLALREELRDLRKELLELVDPIPEVMVMEELPQPRKAYAYFRGEYHQPMYEVLPGTPEIIGVFPEDYPRNRLGLAEWLFDNNNPLTARVTVNRYWQMIFGRGIVSTPEDFGVQGALPSHPELLDWLAVDLMEHDWDLRHLIKKMVMSATYRQSSAISDEHREKDVANVYLSRYPSRRLSAEMIRDNALAASGLLVQNTGGESVRPYQPEGLWIEKGNFSYRLLRYKITGGDSLYRRSLYTFVKRTSPHPFMSTFDAPNREVCTVKREETNTPLQSLVLMNDPQFVEAAKVLAERMQTAVKGPLNEQISFAFRCATGRYPMEEEIKVLLALYDKNYAAFKNKDRHAEELLSVGDYLLREDINKEKTAALTMVANTILNHDDSYMLR